MMRRWQAARDAHYARQHPAGPAMLASAGADDLPLFTRYIFGAG
jgi:hypothetical protein